MARTKRRPPTEADAVFPGTVVIDTREQLAHAFAAVPRDKSDGGGLWTIPTERRALPSGDYSLAGFELRVAVERKSLADLFHTVGQERERFERELVRLSAYDFAAVVVDAEWTTVVESPPTHSHLPPRVIFRSVLAWQQRFPRVHWWFVPGREFAELTTFRVLERFLKEQAVTE